MNIDLSGLFMLNFLLLPVVDGSCSYGHAGRCDVGYGDRNFYF
jgi:hypothetical protein